MNGKTHRIVGLDIGLIAAPIISGILFDNGFELSDAIVNTLALTAGSLFGSIYPDCDLPDSFANKRVKLLPGIFAKKDKTTSRTWVDWGEHRGKTHGGLCSSLWSTLMLAFGMGLIICMVYGIHNLLIPLFKCFKPEDNSYFPEYINAIYFSASRFITYGSFIGGFLLGHISHIFLDWLFGTEGVPIFYPFSKRKYGLRIKMSENTKQSTEIVLRILTYIGVIITSVRVLYSYNPGIFGGSNSTSNRVYLSGPTLEKYEEFLSAGHIAWDINGFEWRNYWKENYGKYAESMNVLNGASSEDYFKKRNEALKTKESQESQLKENK